MSESTSKCSSSGYENEETSKSEKATPNNIFYESCSKTYQTVQRIIFKDSNGIFKETLDVVNGEKRTVFGSPPDLTKYQDWKIGELTESHNIRKAGEKRSTNASQSRLSSNLSLSDTNKTHISSIHSNISKEIQSMEYADLRDSDSSFKPNIRKESKSDRVAPSNSKTTPIKDSSFTYTLDEVADSKDLDTKLRQGEADSHSTTDENASSKDSKLKENLDTSVRAPLSSRQGEVDSLNSTTSDENTGSKDSKFKEKLDTSGQAPLFSKQGELDSSPNNTSDAIADSRDSDLKIKEDRSNRVPTSKHYPKSTSLDLSATNPSDRFDSRVSHPKFTQNLNKKFRVEFLRQSQSSLTSPITNTLNEFATPMLELSSSNKDSGLQCNMSAKYHSSTANGPNRRMCEKDRHSNYLFRTWSPSTTDSKIEHEREDMEGRLTTDSELQNRKYRHQPESEIRKKNIYRNYESVQSNCTKCQHLKSRLSMGRQSNERPSNERPSNTRLSNSRLSKNRPVYGDRRGIRRNINYAEKTMDYLRPLNDSIDNLLEFMKLNKAGNNRPGNDGSIDNLMEFLKQNRTYKSDRSTKPMSKRTKKQFKDINKWHSFGSSDYIDDVSSTSIYSYSPRRYAYEQNSRLKKPTNFMNALNKY